MGHNQYRLEVSQLEGWGDSRGAAVKGQVKSLLGLDVAGVRTRDVYTVHGKISSDEASRVVSELTNPVLQCGRVGETPAGFDWMIVVGFLPGVTDNVGRTAKEAAGDIVGRHLDEEEFVFSSTEYLLSAPGLSRGDVERIAKDLLANELIESIAVYSRGDLEGRAIPLNLPLVTGTDCARVNEYDLDVGDGELLEISRKGILALSLDEMKVIKGYFLSAGGREELGLSRNPTDVELEVLAQTWSEHCKHKIFDAIIDYENEDGVVENIVSCYKSYIKRSTREIGEKVDWLVSVFHDNAGVVKFNDKYDLAYKVETHNSPSALDPYGGAMTGIVGVNRDPMGTGRGADLLINVWGYCLGSPFTPEDEVPEGLLHPRRLRDGIHKGVIDGGNQSGIPYGLGWEFFESRYTGKPLVYCGTVGLIPKFIAGTPGHEKQILPDDLVVMAGGRIGKDGIHGATFSSEELHSGSPLQAVQIGDPITQKKMGDFICEARDKGLYRFITDNGAGGLSSSVGEMASHCGGCRMDLSKAPLKYAGMQPWEILVSEAQERMSFAVPPENIEEFKALAKERDVEVSVLGEFTDTGKFHMLYGDRTVALLDIAFMHDGLPRMTLKAKWTPPVQKKHPSFNKDEISEHILGVVSSLNICSNEYKARQYDHEVKGLSVIKPFVGRGREVLSDATVTMAEQCGTEGIILSAALLPRYSDLDTYHMVACAIDLAIRRILAVGGQPGNIALLDNFCWPDPVASEKNPDGEYKLAQLVRANKALYDYTLAFGTPCVSGKDSMKNDSVVGGRRISIPPTVLFSAVAPMKDISKAVTLDAKFAGDDIYVIGTTKAELGGSEFLAVQGVLGGKVPQIDPAAASAVHRAAAEITSRGLARSLHAPGLGGLAAAFAKIAIGGRLGLSVDMAKLPVEAELTAHELLFSETGSRFVMTASPLDAQAISKILSPVHFAILGKVKQTKDLEFHGPVSARISLDSLLHAYKSPLDGV